MDISQLRDLASAGPARAALVVVQVPTRAQETDMVIKAWWERVLGLILAKPGRGAPANRGRVRRWQVAGSGVRAPC